MEGSSFFAIVGLGEEQRSDINRDGQQAGYCRNDGGNHAEKGAENTNNRSSIRHVQWRRMGKYHRAAHLLKMSNLC